MSNLTLRILTALVILPPVLLLICVGCDIVIGLVAIGLGVAASYEFAAMAGLPRYRTIQTMLSAGAAAGAIALFPHFPRVLPVVVSLWIPLNFIPVMFTSHTMSRDLKELGFIILGAGYTGFLFGAVGVIPSLDDTGRWWLLTLLASVIFNDTLAYTTGRLVGKHPLHKVLSPKKTIEGSLGGIVGSIGAILAGNAIFSLELNLLASIGFGTTMGVVSQVGDLAESFIKRSFNVKDSGKTIPGHGGILDRCDSLIFSAPMVAIFLLLR